MIRHIDSIVSASTWFVLLLTIAILLPTQKPAAQEKPVFEQGKTYVVVYDCLPEYLSHAASGMLFKGQSLNPCYAELLTAKSTTLPGYAGFREFTDEQGNLWSINTNRIIAVQLKQQPALRASR